MRLSVDSVAVFRIIVEFIFGRGLIWISIGELMNLYLISSGLNLICRYYEPEVVIYLQFFNKQVSKKIKAYVI